MEQYLQKLQDLVIEYSPKVITALILLIVGLFAIKIFVNTTNRIMTARKVEITLQKFLINLRQTDSTGSYQQVIRCWVGLGG